MILTKTAAFAFVASPRTRYMYSMPLICAGINIFATDDQLSLACPVSRRGDFEASEGWFDSASLAV